MKWFFQHRFLTILVVLVIIGSIGVVFAKGSHSGNAAPDVLDNYSCPDTSTDRSQSQPQIVPSGSSNILLDVAGTGVKSTQTFTAGPKWGLYWTYDCSKAGNQTDLHMCVYYINGILFSQPPTMGGNSGIAHLDHSGSYYVQINSPECTWKLQVKQ